nr:hypothetical protein [uncultured Albidiferax sp.]
MGAVRTWAMSGEWDYLQHPNAASRPGSYLYEPPGTAHTLKVVDHNTGHTDVVFTIHGAMLVLDARGKVDAVLDAASHIRDSAQALRLREGCKAVPRIIVGVTPVYGRSKDNPRRCPAPLAEI